MSISTNNEHPRLRALDFRPVMQNGRLAILLRDPLRLSDNLVAVPQQLAPALALMDGTRDRSALRAALIVRHQLLVGTEILDRLIDACDEAFLLENDHFRAARRRAFDEYRQAPCRPPALAGQSYPADPDALRELLDGYLAGVDGAGPAGSPDGGRGLLSPHIDYERGGPVYAAVWKQAAGMVRAADLAVILGTDHYSARNLLTLTRQHYATPYGVMPTAIDIVDALSDAIGEEAAFAGELNHRSEHSIELAAVWLHHMRRGQPCEMVPILCGSFARFVEGGAAELESDPTIKRPGRHPATKDGRPARHRGSGRGPVARRARLR